MLFAGTLQRTRPVSLFPTRKDNRLPQDIRRPEHEPYGSLCVAGGHQIGFNDLKTIEVRDFLLAIADAERSRRFSRGLCEVQKARNDLRLVS